MIFDRYRAHLEAELIKQELSLKFVIAEKEKTIQRLDEEIKHLRAKCERYELLLLPRLNPAQPRMISKPRPVELEGETSWLAYLQRYVKQEEELAKKEEAEKRTTSGIHIEGRPSVHESPSNDASRPDGGVQQQGSGPKNGGTT